MENSVEQKLQKVLREVCDKTKPREYGWLPLQPGNGLSDGKPFRMFGGDMIVTGETMPDPTDEDTTKIDLELIASELDRVAKLAGNLKQTDIATEIGALVAKYREQAKGLEG